MFGFLKRLFAGKQVAGRLYPESTVVVSFNTKEVRCERPDGATEKIAWDDLDMVVIETNDQGPIGPDVFWLLLSRNMESGCVYPQGATGEEELLKEMQTRLPGFDNESLLTAMTSVENRRFLAWERST